MSHFHATEMSPKIRAPSIFVRTFGPKTWAMPDFYAPIWAASGVMSYFYADRSRLAGGRAAGASGCMRRDLDAAVGGNDFLGLVPGLYQLAEDGVTYI